MAKTSTSTKIIFVSIWRENAKSGSMTSSTKTLQTEIVSASNPTILGMKVSRKFSKKAVIRNKAKRRIRHSTQLLVKNPDINTDNTSIIVIPKRGFENYNFSKLSNDFFRAFSKIC